LINIGTLCLRHNRYRYPYDEIESQIKCGTDIDTACNDEPPIKMADHFQCERCGEIYLNLTAIGYECLVPSENMEDSLKEYHELSGFREAV
jgi:hypothetical protein